MCFTKGLVFWTHYNIFGNYKLLRAPAILEAEAEEMPTGQQASVELVGMHGCGMAFEGLLLGSPGHLEF